MAVLKNRRKESSVEYVNEAYFIYVQTIEFLSRLSSRYSRIMATSISTTAFEVLRCVESANSIFPSDESRITLREEFLLNAKANLQTLDVALSICYDILMKNPLGAFTSNSGKNASASDAKNRIDSMSQVLGESIDKELRMITSVIKKDKERLKKNQCSN